MSTPEKVIEEVRKSHKTLWILCGLPYSGKSYLSEKILKETSAVYVSIDEIFKSRGFDWNSNRLPDANSWKSITDFAYHKSKKALQSDSNVLYDSTNHTKASRNELRKVARAAGSEAKIIYVKTPTDIVWKRWEENRINKNRPIVDKRLVEMTISSFEPPTEDEQILVVESQ